MTWRLQRNVISGYVAFFAIPLSSLFAHPAAAADWPQFRGSQSNSASAPAPAGRLLVPLWTKRLPSLLVNNSTAAPDVTSSAAIVSSVVYVGSKNTHLYALDAATGTTIWEYAAGTEIESSPLVRDGVVYFVPYNGNLTALNAADASIRWIHPSGGLQDRSSPNVSGSNIICAASFPKTSIYAVPAGSANPAPEAWHFDTQQFVYSSPAVDPATQNVFCASDDGRLYGLEPDGTPLWAQPFQTAGGVFRASPAVANGKVYLSGGDYDWALHAVNETTGEQVWEAPMVPSPAYPTSYYRSIQVSSPAVDGDFVSIVGGYGNSLGSSILYAFRDKGDTVETLWTAPLPNYTVGGHVSSPVLTPADILVGVAARVDATHPNYPTGRVYSVDRVSGKPVWFAVGDPANAGGPITGGPVFASPSVSGNTVVVGDTSGLITAYEAVVAGDVDADGAVTALDAVRMMGPASGNGQAAPAVRYRGDIHPADAVPPDGARSFGNGLITPADADLVLQHAIGLKPNLP